MNIAHLRRKYGSVFVTSIVNGQAVPWKPLTIGEFLEYSELFESEKYSRATIEDEIFKKCVVDDLIVERMGRFPAGVVSTVVNDIVRNSGPETIPELNFGLNLSRARAGQAIHETVTLIAQAFPAYKLEEVYDLDYTTFLLRLAQAESKLLRLGILQESIMFEEPQAAEEKASEATEQKKVSARPSISEITDMLERQNNTQGNRSQTVISASEEIGTQSLLLGHEKEDQVLLRNDMLEDAKHIYKDYFEQMKEGQKVDIESPSERLNAASTRAELNKSAFDTAVKQKQAQDKEIQENIAKAKKRKAAKKK